MKYVVRIINSFNNWFCSQNAIWQTFLATAIWVALEMIYPKSDPNGFILLYVMTILSFVTQPMLAYASSVSANESQKSQDILMQLAKNNIDMMQAILSLMENQEKILTKIDRALSDIAEDVEQIQDEIVEE